MGNQLLWFCAIMKLNCGAERHHYSMFGVHLSKQTCTAKFKLWILQHWGSRLQSMAAKTSYPSASNAFLIVSVLHAPSLKK